MDSQRYCSSATQQVPCFDRQKATVDRDQLQRLVMPASTTIRSVGEEREARSREVPSGEPGRPSIIGNRDECRRLASPLIAVLLASVSERRGGDDAQSILEDHLLRVWDETVSTGFSPDLSVVDSIDKDTDNAKWTTHDTPTPHLCTTYAYQRRFFHDAAAVAKQPVSPPNVTQSRTTIRFSPPSTEIVKRRCVVADLPVQRAPRTSPDFDTPNSIWPRHFAADQMLPRTCWCCVDPCTRAYDTGSGRHSATAGSTGRATCSRCGHHAAAPSSTTQKMTSDDHNAGNSGSSSVASIGGISAIAVDSGAVMRRCSTTAQPVDRQTQTGHRHVTVPTTTRLRTPNGSDSSADDVTETNHSYHCNDADMTIVAYYLCDEPIPYRTTLNSRHPTLGQFKQLVTKRGLWRYFFRKASDEFDSGVVLEEVTDDGAVLPLWDGKVIGKVERVQ